MKKLKLTKVIASALVVASVLALNPIGASAEWKQNQKGWWYTEGNSWAMGWRAIDGSLYYFYNGGYMLDTKPNEFSEAYGLNSSGQFTNVTIDGDWAFCKLTGEIVAYLGSESNVVIPDQIDGVPVTSIGNKSFYENKKLLNVTIPNTVRNIERYAFYGCSNMTSISIPDSVKFIEKYALSKCEKLTNIYIDDNNESYKIVDGVIYSKDGTKIIYYPSVKEDKNYKIPNNVISINDNAFNGCINLTSIEIPNSVRNIGSTAFDKCINLTQINIPDSVTNIGMGAFYGCSSLTDIVIPDSVKTLENSTFQECINLKNITISNSAISIKGNVFTGCKNAIFHVNSEETKQLLIQNGLDENKIIFK